jgi:hypothetical protein
VHGEYDALVQWLIDKWPADESQEVDRPYQVPPEIAWKGPYIYPQRKVSTNTDEEGNEYTVYARIQSRTDVLCLIAVKDLNLISNVPGDVHTIDRDELESIYPEFTKGQAIPYLT